MRVFVSVWVCACVKVKAYLTKKGKKDKKESRNVLCHIGENTQYFLWGALIYEAFESTIIM